MPRELDADARKEWNRLIGKVAGIDERDRGLLTAHCLAWSRMRKASKELEKNGMTVLTPRGCVMASPWVSILNSATRIMETTAAKLGLSPFARGQILTNGTIPDESEWDGLLAEGKDAVKIADVG